MSDPSRLPQKALLFAGFFILYLISTVPVGLFLYSLKMTQGWDIFRYTGWHGYLECLASEADKIGSGPQEKRDVSK